MDRENCDNQAAHLDTTSAATRIKKPSKRSQLPYPKMFSNKPRCSTSEPALSTPHEGRGRSCQLAKSPDVVQSPPKNEDAVCEGTIGARVCIGGEKSGTLLFYGRTKFAKGIWCGVQLDEPVGKNNGTVEGHRYFTCAPGYGIFAPPEKVAIVHDDVANATYLALGREEGAIRAKDKPEPAKRNLGKRNAGGDLDRTTVMAKENETFVLESDDMNATCVINAAKSSTDLSFDPMFESTPTYGLPPQTGKLKSAAVFAMNDLEEDAEENVDVNSNNDDLSELGNAQSGFGQQGSMDHDESLGILTPDQMKDFTLPLDSSCCGYQVQTPSDEGIQEIVEEEVLDDIASETTPVDVSSNASGSKWETSEWVTEYHVWNMGIMDVTTPKFKEDRLQLNDSTICGDSSNNTTETEMETSSISQPDLINNTFVDQKSSMGELITAATREITQTQLLQTLEQTEIKTQDMFSQQFSIEKVSQKNDVWTGVNDFLTSELGGPANVDAVACHLLSMEVDQETRHSLLRVSVKKEVDKPAEMVVSATSIDTGYQGDVECDLQSDTGTNPISTPVDDKQLVDSLHISLEQRLTGRGDPGSDSDFCSDMGASWTESEMDLEDKGGQRGGCRSARIIDGRLYYSGASTSREMRSSTVNRDHSSDAENRRESLRSSEAVGGECERVSDPGREILETNDIANQNESSLLSSDSRQTLASLDTISGKVEESVSPAPSSISYMVQESSSDTLDTTMTLTVTDPTPTKDGPSTTSSNAVNISPVTTVITQETPKSKTKVTPNKRANKDSESSKSKTPRKNVMSKIKAMIEATSNKLTNKDPGSKDGSPNVDNSPNQRIKETKKTPLKNKWNPVMSKIAANQMEEKEKGKKPKREVTSRVNTNLVPARANGHVVNRSPRPEVGATPGAKSANQRHPAAAGARAVPSAKINQKQSTTTQKSRESKTSTRTNVDASVSEHIISQNSINLKSKLPISERPSTLHLRRSANSRSPSELSVASGDSQATTMSQMTLASHSSSRPPLLDTSNASVGSNRVSAVVPNLCRRDAAKCVANRRAMGNELMKNSQRPSKRPSTERVSLLQRKNTARVEKTIGTVDTSDAGSQLRSTQATTNGLVKSGHQPDLLPALVGRSFYSQEVSRLEALCETRTKELNVVQIQLKHCAQGFDSMAVLIDYLTNEMNAFAMPAVREELNVMQAKHRETDHQLKECLQANRNLSKEIGVLHDKHMLEQAEMKRRFRKELESRQTEMNSGHQKVIDKLNTQHDEDKDALKLELSSQIDKLKADFETKEQDEILRQTKSIESLKAEHQKELEDVQRSYEAKIKELEPVVKELEDLKVEYAKLEKQRNDLEDVFSSDADVRVQVIASQRDNLKKEVESLQTVLDMKRDEIKKLQQEKLKLTDISDELDRANDEIKKLHAKNEDLKAMVHNKTQTERHLSSTHEVLQRQYASRTEDNKRLSLENEALHWKLRQSMNGSNSDSEGNPVNYYYFWDDEGMAISSNRSGFMSSSWGGYSSVKHGSPCSPKDRLNWSPSHNCTKAKQAPHSAVTHSHRSLTKADEEHFHDGADVFFSPVTLNINSPKSRKRNSIHSSTPATESSCFPVMPLAHTADRGAPITDNAVTTPTLAKSNVSEIPLINDVSNLIEGEMNQNDSPISSQSSSPVPEVVGSCGEEEEKSGLVVEINDNFEIESKQSLIEADSNEPLNLLESEHQIISEGEEIEVNRWDNFEQVSVRERSLSTGDDYLFEEEVRMPELENLYMMSMKDDDYLEIELKPEHETFYEERRDDDDDVCTQLIDLDPSCLNPMTRSVEVSFNLDLGKSIFTSFQDDLEELVMEPLVLTADNEGVGDVNETSISSEEMLGSLEDSSSLLTMTETSSKETASTNEELIAGPSNALTYLGDPLAAIPKTTTTVVITFRPNPTRTSNCSSRDSSPGQPTMETTLASEDASEAPNTDDHSSSSRASPLGMDETFTLDKKAMQSLNKNVYRGTQSPRTSAGEALMAETEGPPMNVYESHRHQLLKKALQDQLPQSGSSCSSNRELSSDDCSPLVGMSKPDTPDLFVNSPVVNPPIVNGAVNTDDSWSYSDDDLPSETEI